MCFLKYHLENGLFGLEIGEREPERARAGTPSVNFTLMERCSRMGRWSRTLVSVTVADNCNVWSIVAAARILRNDIDASPV